MRLKRHHALQNCGRQRPVESAARSANRLRSLDRRRWRTISVFSHALDLNDMRQFAELHDIELTVIDNDTRLPAFKDAALE